MRGIRTDTVKNEIRRLRRGVSQLLHDDARAQTGPRRPILPPDLTIRDVMQTGLSTVRPDSPLGPAVTQMIEQDVSSLPVTDAEGRILGALNQKDVLRIFYDPDATNVGAVMTTDPIVIAVSAPLIDVIDELMSSEFRRVLVQEGGVLAGVIVRSDLMHAVLLTIEALAMQREQAAETPH
jgi:CBS-domain-containing membrane protein